MRYNICSPREDGDYDVLVSIETDTIGHDKASEIADSLQFTFANDDNDERETVVIITEDVHVLDGKAYIVANPRR